MVKYCVIKRSYYTEKTVIKLVLNNYWRCTSGV